jgi:hypothetical protein
VAPQKASLIEGLVTNADEFLGGIHNLMTLLEDRSIEIRAYLEKIGHGGWL